MYKTLKNQNFGTEGIHFRSFLGKRKFNFKSPKTHFKSNIWTHITKSGIFCKNLKAKNTFFIRIKNKK
jgi:hypothetical protein